MSAGARCLHTACCPQLRADSHQGSASYPEIRMCAHVAYECCSHSAEQGRTQELGKAGHIVRYGPSLYVMRYDKSTMHCPQGDESKLEAQPEAELGTEMMMKGERVLHTRKTLPAGEHRLGVSQPNATTSRSTVVFSSYFKTPKVALEQIRACRSVFPVCVNFHHRLTVVRGPL